MNFLKDFQTEIKTFLIVAVIAIVFGIGTIFFLREVAPVPADLNPVAQQTSLLAPSPEPQAIDISAWKTYRNGELGFEIKYPADWRKWKEGGAILFGQQGSGPGFSPRAIGITIRIYETLKDLPQNENGASLDEWVQNQYASLVDQPEEMIEETKVGIGEYFGWRIEIFKELGVTSKIPRVYVQTRNGAIFELEGFIPTVRTAQGNFPGDYNYQKVFDQMLTTFLHERGTFFFRKEGDRLIVENGKTYEITASKTNPFSSEQTIYFAGTRVGIMIVAEGQTLRFLELQGVPNDVRTNLDEMSYFADANTLVLGGKFGEGLGCAGYSSEEYLVVDLRENMQQNQKGFSFSSSADGYLKEGTQGQIETFESAGDTYMCRKECWDQTYSFSFEDEDILSYSAICSNTQKEITLTFTSDEKEVLKNVYPVEERYLLREGFFDLSVRKNIQLFSDQRAVQFFLDGTTYQFDYTTKELTPVKQ